VSLKIAGFIDWPRLLAFKFLPEMGHMAKPEGKCAFCGGPKLTKGHIWPESFGKLIPSDAKYHEQKIAGFVTFESNIPGPSEWMRVGTGPLQKRRPRNTCSTCNSGWMSKIEEAALPVIGPLITGQRTLLHPSAQEKLASVITLISTRVELIAYGMRSIPKFEKDELRKNPLPTPNWRIWIARHAGKDAKDFQFRFTAMQIASDKSTPVRGPEHCNSHLTSLIAGQLFIHVFFSTVWPDFPGYRNVSLIKLWPPSGYDIDSELLPSFDDESEIRLHETISREGKAV
jgi:hypothetical protein